MRISTRCQHATRALLELAQHQDDGPTTLKEIARRHDITASYLMSITEPLVNAGIIRTQRGARGGLVLRKHPNEIRMGDIFRIYEGHSIVDHSDEPLLGPDPSPRADLRVWATLRDKVFEVLDSVTLEDLADHRVEPESDSGEVSSFEDNALSAVNVA